MHFVFVCNSDASLNNSFQVVTCERDVSCLLKMMCDVNGDVFFTR